MKITFNGVTMEGTTLQIMEVLKKLGYDSAVYHFSESKGTLVPIVEMDTVYIANCINKMFREWKQAMDNSGISVGHGDYLLKLITSTHFYALLKEYMKREDRNG